MKSRKRDDFEDLAIKLPCGHWALGGGRPGMWINDEYFGWCQECGVVYNAKILKELLQAGEITTDFITKKQQV